MRKINIIIACFSIVMIIFLGVGISYSMWNISLKEDKVNTVMTSCFDITYSSDNNNINLSNTYPITDEKGLSLTPYTFTITNNCDINAYYKINLETLNNSNIDNKFMKVSLNESNPKKINTYESTDKVLNNSKISNNLLTGYLPVGGTENFNLRVWMDYDTTINDIKNDGTDKWIGKVVVVESPVSNEEINKACHDKGGDLIDNGECRKYYVKLNQKIRYPNFEKEILSGGWNADNLIIEKNNLHYNPAKEYIGTNAVFYVFSENEKNHIIYEYASSNMNFVQFHFQNMDWICNSDADDTGISSSSNFSFDPKKYNNYFAVYYSPGNIAKYFSEAQNCNPDFSKSWPYTGLSFYIGKDDYLKLSYQNINLIDLTLMFGEGNEPSKEWCDKYLTNYYEYNTEGTLMPIKDIGVPVKTSYYDKINMFD